MFRFLCQCVFYKTSILKRESCGIYYCEGSVESTDCAASLQTPEMSKSRKDAEMYRRCNVQQTETNLDL